MKYSILLCLLLVLVNSKIEPKSFFTKVIKHYIEDEDYGEEEEEDEYCSYKLDKKHAKVVQLRKMKCVAMVQQK